MPSTTLELPATRVLPRRLRLTLSHPHLLAEVLIGKPKHSTRALSYGGAEARRCFLSCSDTPVLWVDLWSINLAPAEVEPVRAFCVAAGIEVREATA